MTNEQRYRQQAAIRRLKEQWNQTWSPREAEIRWLYGEQMFSIQKIGEYYGVNQVTIWKAMKRLGIKRRSRACAGERNGRYKNGLQVRGYRRVITKDKCRKCGTTSSLGIHHKNDDHYDNRVENLEVLCNSCHMSETKLRWWAAKKSGKPLPKSNGPVGWVRQNQLCAVKP